MRDDRGVLLAVLAVELGSLTLAGPVADAFVSAVGAPNTFRPTGNQQPIVGGLVVAKLLNGL